MLRFAFAASLVAATFVFTMPALSQQDLEQPSAPGGLGNTRSDLDRVYGPVHLTNVSDLGDYTIDAVSYEDAQVFYIVEDGTAPSPNDRVSTIDRYPNASDDWAYSYSEAIAVANQLLPADVVPTSDLLPYDLTGTSLVQGYRQTFYSESMSRLFPDPEVYLEGEPGTVWLVLPLRDPLDGPSGNFDMVSVRIEHP